MKSTLCVLAMGLLASQVHAQEINPIKMGQIFEQGYGREIDDWEEDESGLDIIQSPTGLVMTGWIGDDANGKNVGLWTTDDIGAQTYFGEFGTTSKDEIGAAVALASDGQYVIVGREADTYSDQDHSTINFNDEILVKGISSAGVELWSLNLSMQDYHQVGVDVINDGSDNFIVLANRTHGEHNDDIRVLKIAKNGNVIWDQIHALSNKDLFAQKVHDMGNGHYLILANEINSEYPLLMEIDGLAGTYETHRDYIQAHPTTCYGMTANSSGYFLAGKTYNGMDDDGFLLHVDNNLNEGTHNIEMNPGFGDEFFRDVIAHNNGYLAVGECNNLGEGNRDAWVVHFDQYMDPQKVETLGGEETDYAQAAVLVPNAYSVFFAGYNNSYSVVESGNAYVGGIKVDMGIPESGLCVIPRVLEADMLAGRDNSSGNIIPKILDPSSTTNTNNLINYMLNNHIKYLAMFRLGFIFDNLGNTADKNQYQNLLDNFLQDCKRNGIICGYVADKDINAINNVANYNIQKHNNQRAGKIHFVKLEHEYWNAYNDPDLNATRSGTPEPTLSAANKSLVDIYYQELHTDHMDLIGELNLHKTKNANMWQVYDYIAKLYLESTNASNCTYHKSYLQGRKDKALDLDGLSDAIFLAYYQNKNAGGGTDFLDPTSSNGNVIEWRRRLSYFGNSSANKTKVIPLYSAEDEAVCGGNPFLGDVLEGLPGNGPENMNSVEGDYNTQHGAIYNSTDPAYAQVKNVSLAAYGWFKYQCLQSRSFTNRSLQLCSNLGFVYDPLSTEDVESSNWVKLYPNPGNGELFISSESLHIMKVEIFDNLGRSVYNSTFENQATVEIQMEDQGFYYVNCTLEDGTQRSFKYISE